jgi:hypothetical protein
MVDDTTVEQAVQSFIDAANAKGDPATPPDRGHLLLAEMARAITILRAAGPAGHARLRLLLRDASPFVRSWAATELLSSGNGDAEAAEVLADLAELPGPVGLNAETVLAQHREGRLQSPFRSASD